MDEWKNSILKLVSDLVARNFKRKEFQSNFPSSARCWNEDEFCAAVTLPSLWMPCTILGGTDRMLEERRDDLEGIHWRGS